VVPLTPERERQMVEELLRAKAALAGGLAEVAAARPGDL
jgi:hypothetical protein